MGSPERLNYTVLGEIVNLASRLCGAADFDQVLVSAETVRASGVAAVSLGGRALKGFSGDVEVFAVEEGAKPAGKGTLAGLAIALVCLSASPLAAQSQGALWWASPSGAYQAGLSGRLDVEAYVPDTAPAGLLGDTSAFAAGRLRVFLDAFAGELVYGSAELRLDRGETPTSGDLDARIEQAFLRVQVGGAPLQIQIGKFASPFGAYAQRHHTVADVFIRPPLPYDAHTVVSSTVLPPNAAAFLTWRDRPDEFRAEGAPPVWNVPYQWGALATASAGPLDVRAGWMNSMPSSPPAAWGWRGGDLDPGALVLGAGWTASPELRVGASWTRGPFLQPLATGALPPGAALADYHQALWGVDATFSRGPVVLRGEMMHDTWEIPNVADAATDLSGYLEAQTDIVAGLWIAARVAAIHYSDVSNGSGAASRWDYDTRRAQLAAGYRIIRSVELKAEVMRTDAVGPIDPSDDLLSFQVWWAF